MQSNIASDLELRDHMGEGQGEGGRRPAEPRVLTEAGEVYIPYALSLLTRGNLRLPPLPSQADCSGCTVKAQTVQRAVQNELQGQRRRHEGGLSGNGEQETKPGLGYHSEGFVGAQWVTGSAGFEIKHPACYLSPYEPPQGWNLYACFPDEEREAEGFGHLPTDRTKEADLKFKLNGLLHSM